jgi:protein MpaA
MSEPAEGPSADGPYLKRFIAGHSVENRPIECLSIGKGEETVLILASIHGNEPAGTPLLWRLAEHLRENPQLARDRRIVLVPEVNPDGLHHRTRCNVRGVDLNRNFPTSNRRNSKRYGREALSEPEAAVLERFVLDCRPARIVSIHQPLACIDYDGPAMALAERMSECCGLPVRRLGSLPGSLGSFTGNEKSIPTITLELPRNAERLGREELWELYGGALLTAIFFPRDPPISSGPGSGLQDMIPGSSAN